VFRFSLQLLSETFLILRRIKRYMIKIYIGLHVKYPLFFSDFNEIWFFFRQIFEKYWKKIRPVGAKLFHADGRIDRHDEANSRFSQFCEKRLKIKFRLLFWRVFNRNEGMLNWSVFPIRINNDRFIYTYRCI